MRNPSVGVLIVLHFVLIGCQDDGSGPPPPPPKDPRTYTWTVDTLQHPESFQTMMTRIWGSSPNNVYVVGHNDVGKRKMYHYDGQRWDVVPLTQNEGGPIDRPNLSDVFGFSTSNIYVVGDRPIANPNPPPQTISASLIICFDGVQWREIPTTGLFLEAVAGNSAGMAYTAGGGNVGFFLGGTTATPDTIPITPPENTVFQVNSVSMSNAGDVYALANWHNNTTAEDRYYFLHRGTSIGWRIVDSATVRPGLVENKWGYARVWYSPWSQLFSVYAGVFRWNGSTWDRIYVNSDNIGLTDIKGKTAMNLFVCGYFGLLYHFDGHDWYQYQQFADINLVLTDLLIFENEVFLLGHQAGGYRSYVFHGK